MNTIQHRFTPLKRPTSIKLRKLNIFHVFFKISHSKSFNEPWVLTCLHHPHAVRFQESPRTYGPEHWNFLQLSRQEPGPPAEKLHRAAPASEPGCCAQAPSLAPEKVEQQGRVSQMKLGMIDGGEIQRLVGKCWEKRFLWRQVDDVSCGMVCPQLDFQQLTCLLLLHQASLFNLCCNSWSTGPTKQGAKLPPCTRAFAMLLPWQRVYVNSTSGQNWRLSWGVDFNHFALGSKVGCKRSLSDKDWLHMKISGLFSNLVQLVENAPKGVEVPAILQEGTQHQRTTNPKIKKLA